MPWTMPLMTRAMSGIDSRWPMPTSRWSSTIAWPPSSYMACSKLTRVRRLGFSNRTARLLPRSGAGGEGWPRCLRRSRATSRTCASRSGEWSMMSMKCVMARLSPGPPTKPGIHEGHEVHEGHKEIYFLLCLRVLCVLRVLREESIDGKINRCRLPSAGSLENDLRSDPRLREDLQQDRVGDSAVDDVGLVHAALQGGEAGLDLGEHAGGDDALVDQASDVGLGQVADE